MTRPTHILVGGRRFLLAKSDTHSHILYECDEKELRLLLYLPRDPVSASERYAIVFEPKIGYQLGSATSCDASEKVHRLMQRALVAARSRVHAQIVKNKASVSTLNKEITQLNHRDAVLCDALTCHKPRRLPAPKKTKEKTP